MFIAKLKHNPLLIVHKIKVNKHQVHKIYSKREGYK